MFKLTGKLLPWQVVIVWFSLVLIHIIMSINMTGPIVIADETGYLANARLFAGYENVLPPEGTSANYPWGYSILLIPIMIFIKDPTMQYHLVLIVNSILLGSVFVPSYMFLKNYWDSMVTCVLAGAAIALYPAIFLYSNVALSENVFILLQVLAVYLLYNVITKKGIASPIAFGLICTYSYYVRANGLSTLIAGLTIVIFAYRCKLISSKQFKYFNLSWFIALLVGVALQELFFGNAAGLTQHGGKGFVSLFSTILTFKGLAMLVQEMSGQLFYIFLASLLLVPFLLLNFLSFTFKNIKGRSFDEQYFVVSFVVLSFLGTFLVSSLFMVNQVRGDHLIYGRYNEGYIAALMLVGVWLLNNIKKDKKFYLYTLTSVFVLLLFMFLTGPYEVKPINTLNILMFQPIFSTFSHSRYVVVGVLLVISLAIFLVAKFKFKFALFLMIFLYGSFSLYAYDSWFLESAEGRAQEREIVKFISNNPHPDELFYDRHTYSAFHFHTYQYFLPNIDFIRFQSNGTKEVESDFIISGRKDFYKLYNGARLVALENHHPQALWVLPGHYLSELIRRNRVFPENYDGCLPKQAFKSRININNLKTNKELLLKRGELKTIELVITNDSLYPWPNLYGWGNAKGAVRVGYYYTQKQSNLKVAQGRAELPYTLYPGESVTLKINLDTLSNDNNMLEPGKYDLNVSLVQEGVAWFFQKGDELITIPVIVRK